jgi:hypothetical protein
VASVYHSGTIEAGVDKGLAGTEFSLSPKLLGIKNTKIDNTNINIKIVIKSLNIK